jgi:uncharacterized repeat protein (TIGR02543 family)
MLSGVRRIAVFFTAAVFVFALAACPAPTGDNDHYTITFDSQEGTELEPITRDEGTEVPEPTAPTKADHTFQGWHDAASGGTKYGWPHTLTGDVTMYAQWQAVTPVQQRYTIIFYSHGGSDVQPITANAGSEVDEPPKPTKKGNTFQGWFSAESDGTKHTWPHTLTDAIIMHAQWLEDPPPPPVLSGAVTVTGTVRKDHVLTANIDSLEGSGTIRYQWQRGNSTNGPFADISAAGDASYTLTAEDLHKYIRVTVSRADNNGTIRSASVGPVVLPLLAGEINVTGIVQTGQALTANTGSLEGNGTISYRWQRANAAVGGFADIPGATTASYTLATADQGTYIRVTVRRAGNNGTLSSNVVGPVVFPPLTGTVSITGTPRTGLDLTANTGSLGGSGEISYRWERADSAVGIFVTIPNATGLTYRLVTADQDKYIRVTVRRTGNSETKSSVAIGRVVLPSLTGTVAISGSAQVGLPLTADTSALGGSGELIYRWQRGDSADGPFVPIPDAFGQTYTLTAKDLGKHIRVTVTREAHGGIQTSVPTAAVVLQTP